MMEENLLELNKRLKKRKIINYIGKILAAIFSLASGAIGAVAIISVLLLLHITSGGITTYLIAGIIGVSSTLSNYFKLYRIHVPAVLLEMLGGDRIFAGFFVSENGKPFTRIKKNLMIVGIVFAISVGVTAGAVTYISAFSMAGLAISVGILSMIFPAFGIILFLSALICVGALMLDSILKLAKTENIWQKCKQFLFNIVDTNPNLPRNKNKSSVRIIFERFITVFLMIFILPLSILGLFLFMNYCTKELGIIILKIPGAIPEAVDWSSKVISLGIAFLAQIPFTVRTSLMSLNVGKPEKTENKKVPRSWFSRITFQISRLISAIANGAASACGAGSNILMIILGALSGFMNAFTGCSDPGDEDDIISDIKRYDIKPIFPPGKTPKDSVVDNPPVNTSIESDGESANDSSKKSTIEPEPKNEILDSSGIIPQNS